MAEFELFTFAALLSLYGPGSSFSPEDDEAALAKIKELWNDNDFADTVRKIVESGIFVLNFEQLVPGFSAKAGEYLNNIRTSGMEKALSDFLNAHA